MNDCLVVIINGMPGSGKDTFVETLKPIAHSNRIEYQKVDDIKGFFWLVSNFHGSDPQKRALEVMGWDGVKTPNVRNLLSDLIKQSDELFNCTEQYFDKSIQAVIMSSQDPTNSYVPMVFLHIREPERIEYYRKKYNAVTVLVERDYEQVEHVYNSSDNPDNISLVVYDYYIDNKGNLNDLYESVITFFEDISKYYVNYRRES